MVSLFVVCFTIASSANVIAQQSDVPLSPLKQIKLGVLPQHVQCEEGFVLVIFAQESMPACVSKPTAEKLSMRGWITPAEFDMVRPSPSGYLGGYFLSSGIHYPLKRLSLNLSNSSIPQSSTSGNFSFLFSTSNYTQKDISVSYQSCSGNLDVDFETHGTNMNEPKTNFIDFENIPPPLPIPQPPSHPLSSARTNVANQATSKGCTPPQSLDFTYGQNSKGQYAATTQNVVIPCGAAQTISGHVIPTNYYLVSFSVNTTGYSTPYSFIYLIYGGC